MTDEKNTRNTTPETAKPEPTLTNPVEQSFAEAERLAEQAEAAAKDEPCCDMPKPKKLPGSTETGGAPTPPQYQPPQYTYAAYTAQPQQPTPQEGAGDYRPPRYTEQYQANANNANYNNPQQTYYAPNGQPQYGRTTHSRMTRRRHQKPHCSRCARHFIRCVRRAQLLHRQNGPWHCTACHHRLQLRHARHRLRNLGHHRRRAPFAGHNLYGWSRHEVC